MDARRYRQFLRRQGISNKGRGPLAMWTRILRRCLIQSEDAEKQTRRGTS